MDIDESLSSPQVPSSLAVSEMVSSSHCQLSEPGHGMNIDVGFDGGGDVDVGYSSSSLLLVDVGGVPKGREVGGCRYEHGCIESDASHVSTASGRVYP
jgi:hypothetical protein